MKIEHSAVYYNDLERARDFFITYFDAISNKGYHNKTTDFRSYFLSFDDGSRLEIMHRPGLLPFGKSEASTGYHHIAFSLGSKEKVDELTNRLITDGFQLASGPRTTGDGYYESCILDFEGNRIELTE